MKTTVSIKLDAQVKQQAAQVAQELGFSLSAIINANLKQLIKTRELHISSAPQITPYLEGVIKQAEIDRRAKRLKTYDSLDDMFAELD